MTSLRHDQAKGDALSEVRRPQDKGCAFILLCICLFIQRSNRDCVGPSQKIHKSTFKHNQEPNHHTLPLLSSAMVHLPPRYRP
jgi:hypothetical protein